MLRSPRPDGHTAADGPPGTAPGGPPDQRRDDDGGCTKRAQPPLGLVRARCPSSRPVARRGEPSGVRRRTLLESRPHGHDSAAAHDRGEGLTYPERLSASLRQLHTTLLRQQSLDAVLHAIVHAVTHQLPGDVDVSVCVLAATGSGSLVATGPLAFELDELQCRDGDGPAVHAARTGRAAEVLDARIDSRWPAYMPQAVQRGAASSLSMGLGHHGPAAAGLNIYSRHPAAFPRDCQRTAKQLARFGARALAHLQALSTAEQFADAFQAAHEARLAVSWSHCAPPERRTAGRTVGHS